MAIGQDEVGAGELAGSVPTSERATPEFRKRAAVDLIDSHDSTLRRTARRYSLCADDSEDAYQRSLEILLTKAPAIEGESLLRWMQVVTRREALSVRKLRERMLGNRPSSADGDVLDPFDLIPSESPGPSERAENRERVHRGGEALRSLKPQEVRALSLKAQGYSYTEIGEMTGWSYTKINRCMAEGRKRFLQTFSDIEEGRHCEQYTASLSAFADGEAPAPEPLKVHLRSCAHCRATLAVYRGLPARLLAALTPTGAAADPGVLGHLRGAGSKLAELGDRARESALGVVTRGGGDGASQVAMSGGTRGMGMAGLAKLLAVCGATAAGGAACVATGVVPSPGLLDDHQKPAPIEQASDPTPVIPPTVIDDSSLPSVPSPAKPGPKPAEPTVVEPPPTPEVQTQDQFGVQSSAPPASSSSGGGSGGGSSGGKSGGGSGGQFGFQ